MVHSHIPIAQKKFDGHATTRHSTKYLKASFMHLNTYIHSFSSERGVRTKIFCITFDTQGEQKLMGPGNVGWELFAQLQNIQVKCRKKA